MNWIYIYFDIDADNFEYALDDYDTPQDILDTLTEEQKSKEINVYLQGQDDIRWTLDQVFELKDLDEGEYINLMLLLENWEPIANALTMYWDVISYQINSYRELAEYYIDEWLYWEVPDHLTAYIDYEKLGRDLAIDMSEADVNWNHYYFTY